MGKPTVTGEIYTIIFDLLERHPKGLRWSQILKQIENAHPHLHPKTINGCVWKLVQKFPDKVYKPAKGVFCLRKYEGKM